MVAGGVERTSGYPQKHPLPASHRAGSSRDFATRPETSSLAVGGYRLLLWECMAANYGGLHFVARPVIESLATETGETVLLTVYQNGEVICIEKVDSSQAVRLAWKLALVALPTPGHPLKS